MDRLRALMSRARRIDLSVVDVAVSVVLVAFAIADARDQLPAGSFGAAAVVLCVLCGGSVAWRRARPAWACFAACTGYAALAVVTGYDAAGVFEWVPVALTFYTLGRQPTRGRVNRVVLGLSAYWLVAAVLIYYAPTAGSAGGALGLWALGLVSYAVGDWFAVRSRMIGELAARATALEREQALRAGDAVAEERRGMARELHDVVAHCVSVMVVQTVGARSIAAAQPTAAAGALSAVERAGREALVELRRIVGVLRHDGDPLADATVPTLAQLHVLVERAGMAGVPVELHVDGARRDLPAGLELVAYRLVQEALTNVIKHSGAAAAQVRLGYADRELRIEVSDTGGSASGVSDANGSGLGLRGMRERVAVYGGELDVGPLAAGGFAVRARIPYAAQSAPVPETVTPRLRDDVGGRDRPRWPWLDPVLGAVALLILEQRVLAAHIGRGPLAVSVLAAAGIALATVGRRRHPVVFFAAVVVLDLLLVRLGHFKQGILTIYMWTWALYTLAAWARRWIAVAGLAGLVGVLTIAQILGTSNANAGLYVGFVFCLGAAWGCGYAMRSRRRMTRQLERISTQLAEEREDRARLAVVAERSRIARELHSAVARSVAAMVVQAEAAATRLDHDPRAADAIMQAIEDTGRATLADMRRILGVLRRPGETSERTPRPGVDQIHALIRRARASGQPVRMEIDGEPGTLPPGVEVGLYRILEEALDTARAKPERPVDVSLRFGADELELRVRAQANDWPTAAMRECASMCDGKLTADRDADGRCGLLARLPTLAGAFG